MIQKIAKWVGLLLVTTLLLLLLFLHALSGFFRGDNDKIKEHFESSGFAYEIHQELINERPMRWITTGNQKSNKGILFLHGAPGSWQDFSEYLIDQDFQDSSFMIAMDRPGYGYSDYGHAEISVIAQVEIAQLITSNYDVDSLIVVGYSYGGPVAGAYAARYPERVSDLLLLAPVIAPYDEKIFWFNHVIEVPIIKILVPKFISVANDEKLSHTDALIAIKDDWASVYAKTKHLHCMDDWIAPYQANVNWTREHMNQVEIIDWEGDSHFLPNNVYNKVKPVLLQMVYD